MKFFSANYFTSEKFVAQIFTRTGFTHGFQAVLVVPHDHQSAVLPGTQNLFFLDLQPSLMLLLSYIHVAPRVLRDPAGPLLSELSPSAIAEANAAVNNVHQAKKRDIDRAKDRAYCTRVRIQY